MHYIEQKRESTVNDTHIKGFVGQMRWLSNFDGPTIQLEGMQFPQVENAYQAAKLEDWEERKRFQTITPGKAQRLGQEVLVRPNWERLKTGMMMFCLLQKFRDPVMRKLLLGTGTKTLEETNDWGDHFWGTDWKTGYGANTLGLQIMMIRSLLREES